jgi:hypothetical protein
MTSIRYQVGGALLQDVSSYVTRDSDHQLLEALKAGEFCYVLNSRQMGKSSLMVRTLAQLQEVGWKGIILDFSAKDTQSDQPSFWYNGIINQLNNHFKLLDRGDFRAWLKDRDFISPVERLGEFIETVLLPGIIEPIIIFVDEIDSTLGLPFTDDFFALIRACYNRRAEKPDYKRLTFALLGVAAPSELIGDTKRTPFNIGKSIDLSGFSLTEAQPLAAGLAEKSEHPQAVLEAILYWTGGQPFLSQRLCQLVADANDHITAGSEAFFVEGLVRSRLIENWESQDQQEHLKTIRRRVIENEQKAGYLLELYRQTRQAGSLPVQNRPEEQELQLSGLVVKRDGNLQVYNPIYAEVFNESWIDGELVKLRPYAESFRAWVISGKLDKSRLLRGDALREAEQWAKEKNPSAEDQDFLSASRTQEREEEIAVKERDAELERERQDKEVAEKAKKIEEKAREEAEKSLAQANQRIRLGTVVLFVALLIAGGFGVAASLLGKKALDAQKAYDKVEKYLADTQQLSELAGKISTINQENASEIQKLANIKIDDPAFSYAFLQASKSLAYQYLPSPELNQAKTAIDQSLQIIINREKEITREHEQKWNVKNFAYFVKENLSRTHSKNEEIKNRYNKPVRKFILLAELDSLMKQKKWKEADEEKNWAFILFIANREKEGYLALENVKNFSCPDLKKLDDLWVKNSNGKYGYSAIKKKYLETGNSLKVNWNTGIGERDVIAYNNYLDRIGWREKGEYVPYDKGMGGVGGYMEQVGHLPFASGCRWRWRRGVAWRCFFDDVRSASDVGLRSMRWRWARDDHIAETTYFSLLAETCGL